MQLVFSKAKDQSQTFSVDGVFFHSSYSPAKEADRFIQNINFTFTPDFIFLIEPGLSYTNEVLKKKFPQCKTICIRLFDQLLGDESVWDYCIKYSDCNNLKSYLINNFGEEKLLSSTIIISKSAENLFNNQINLLIEQYKNALEEAKTLLVTRQFFEKKWLLNSCNYLKYARNFCQPHISSKQPVVICASGPSLQNSISVIKENFEKCFVICLSSATSVLLNNNIIPDLILTTDGGWWAGEHLKSLKVHNEIPIAAPCEAFIPKVILKNNPLLTLQYNDSSSFISTQILEQAGLQTFNALRNPTVSGTALFLAKAITDNKIFFCGLDLAGEKGQQHTKPNEIEKDNLIKDNRLKNTESRIAYSRYNTQSLGIYRDWFCEQKDLDSVYRVIDFDKCKQAPLGQIKDISSEAFKKEIEKLEPAKKINLANLAKAQSVNIKQCFDFICQKLLTSQWQKQIFPADFLAIKNCNDENQKEKLEDRLNSKIQKLILTIRKIADE